MTLTLERRPPEEPAAERPRPRASWHVRANAVVVGYLALTVVAVLAHDALPVPRWLAVHLLMLGAVTNAIVTWSEHFSVALLRAPTPSRRRSAVRLVALNASVLGVLAGVTTSHVPTITVAASALLVVVLDHVVNLVRIARKALQGRFARTVRFYVAAGLALVVGITLGGHLAVDSVPPGDGHLRFHAGHVHANLLGWVGLSVLGTLFTLWPTVLRTRMVEGIERAARACLLLTVGGLATLLAALLVGHRALAVAGLGLYALGVAAALDPFVRTWRQRAPHDAASWTLAAGTGWLLVGVVADLLALATSPSLGRYLDRLDALVPLLAVGFVGQVLLGALTYLLPVVLGRGPTGFRSVSAVLGRAWPARLVLLNAGVAVVALPLPDPLPRLGWAMVLASAGGFVVLALLALTGRARSAPSDRAANPALAGVALGLVVALVPVGIAVSGSDDEGTETQVVADGSRPVEVTLVGLDVRPAVVEVPAGTRLRLRVTNDAVTRHDLAFADGPTTGLLAAGESRVLDLGTVETDLQAWCTLPGHRAAGMTLDVRVAGAGSHAGHRDHAAHGSDPAVTDTPAGDVPAIDFGATPAPGWRPYDATLRPAPGGTEHRLIVRAQEKVLEVAPGVRQRMWTFNGTVPGPTLRGTVGDVFTVTFVNEGTLGHGIDFHAGSLAPDRPMRTIDPGERLTYQFRADYAGAWLYHCSTMPMLHHIGNGMFGAVVIDPPDLPAVDHEYVLVQSELYLGPAGRPGDLAKMQAGARDAAVFNGYVGQYAHRPLTARPGERVRFWVVDAGPSDGTSFHVVGAQFDTVYKEGAYLLRPGAGRGGAQSLDLSPAQGGFVEAVFREPGHYPFVDHAMRDAEAGARGLVEVSP